MSSSSGLLSGPADAPGGNRGAAVEGGPPGDRLTGRGWFPRFVEDHPVILFDHVGSGASDLSAYDRSKFGSLHGYVDVLEILADLDLHHVVFVGHSVSAMIGVLAATRDPSRFAALVLVGERARYS